ncbi:MAG: hypothetical protein HN644_13580 [Rhodospirillales bacterium]|jgi:hypothetical protein|nr:hypothetical protein [Rhodospirillales bacterium]MBT4041366.1 hypothetical protein [Rhodospirillales bacterium]MBT4626290.1 hypothetical protein [Rhodospirillales bacterium]MBT5353043.1 hypothetical protein [Rhodospirillales bacterium]MBT5520520.1 hypothetical protein [Rhodospirillales bacterium]
MYDDKSISTLLDLDGSIIEQAGGFWVKIVAHRVEPDENIPHGNAHAPPPPRKFKYAGVKFTYDHKHRSSIDKGVTYKFQDAYQLMSDFFADVDNVIKEAAGQ